MTFANSRTFFTTRKFSSILTSLAMIASTFAPLVAVPATAFADTVSAGDVVINEFLSHSSTGSEWVELYNTTGTAIDFSTSNWKIQDRTFSGSTPTGTATTTITSGTLPANGFLEVNVSGLNDNGDIITLFDDSGNQIDQVVYGTITGYTEDVAAPGPDQSAYRTTDGGTTWAITDTPTPNKSNVIAAADTIPPTEPVATPIHGFYYGTQNVTFSSTDNSGATPTIYYTTDGSTPSDSHGTKYTGGISVSAPGESIEAIAYDAAGNKSTVGVYTYIVIPSIFGGTATLTTQPESVMAGDPITLDAVYEINGLTTYHPAGQSIEFTVDGQNAGSAVTDANGEAKLIYTPSPVIAAGSYSDAITASTDAGPFGTIMGSADLTVTGAATPPAKPVEDTTNSTYFSSIQAAVDAANPNDTIALLSDITVPAQVNVNKAVTIDGEGHTVSVSGTGYRFLITADGTTMKDMNVTKTDKTGVQNIIGIQADDVTIDSVNFVGQYAAGDGEVSRALEVSGNNFTIENSSFKNLRQPAYINSFTGSVTNNYTDGTKGWVVVQDSDVTFSGNTWGTNATDIAIIQQGTGVNHYTCPVTAQIVADNNGASVDNQVDTSCTPALNAENFNTVNDSTYKGISVGFDAKDFGTVNAVTVDMTRADGSHAIKHGTQDLFDLISANTAPYQFTAPFVIEAGSYDPTTDKYWTSDPADWSDATTPTSVTITVTGTNGTESVTNSNFSQGSPSWPTYGSLLPPTPPAAPENVNLTQGGNAYVCDAAYFNANSDVYGTHLNWTVPAGETETGYKVVPTYPSGSHGTAYTGTSGTSVWIGANIGQGYGKAPNDQGTYAYSITYKDLLGNWSSPATCSFIYDSVAPTVSVAPSASALTGTATFDITINDTNAATSSNKAIYVYLYNTTDNSQKYGEKVDLSSGTGTFTVDTTKLADGSYNLDVAIVHDAAGNASGVKDNYFSGYTIANGLAAPTNLYAKFQYDTQNIADGTTLNKTASTTGNNLLLGWKAPAGAVAGYRILTTYPDGTTNLSYQGANNWSWIVSGEGFGSQQGKYTFQVEAVDSNNIVSSLSAPFTLSYDTHSPTAQFDPTPAKYVNGNFTVSGDAQDNVALKGVLFDVRDPAITSGNSWAAGCVSGSQTTTWITASTSLSTSCVINIANLTEGKTYTLRIHAGDYAGYGGGAQQDLIVDKTAPTITVKDGYTGDLATNTFSNVSFKLHDNNAVDYYTLNGHKHDLSNNAWSDANFPNIKGELNAGSNTITVYDVAGNSTSYTFTYGPAGLVYVTTDAATNVTFSDTTLNGTNGISDAVGHSFWVSTSTIDTSSPNIPVNVYSTPDFGTIAANTDFSALLSSLTATDGAYVHGQTLGAMPAITPDTTYHYVAWSHVGGTWHPGVEQMFTTALETPTIASPFDGESTTTAGWQNITWTAVPSTNGPVTYTYQVSGSDTTSADGSFVSPSITTPGITTTSISQGNTGDGTYYMHVMATDSAGNTSAWSPTVEVIVDNSGSGGGTTPITHTFATSTVTIGNLNGWAQSVDDGGNVAFLPDINAPLGNGALELTTTGDNNSATHFTHSFDIPLSDLTAISYSTKQVAAPNKQADNATLRINVNLDGTSNTVDDQLMYEPYYNGFDGRTMTGWNAWNISTTTGKFWSNKDLTYNKLGGVSAGSYSSNFTLADVLKDHPNAKIVGLVLSMGTWNPSQEVLADRLIVSELDGATASTTVFDFEPRTGTVTTITNAGELSSTPSIVNQPFAVKWSVVPTNGSGNPTGTVTVTANGGAGCSADVADGQCEITPSSTGTMELQAIYGADSSFDQSSSAKIVHEIDNANSNTGGTTNGSTGTGNGPTVGNSGLLGDLNNDGHVNFLDFALLMTAMGETGNNIPADLNNDLIVNLADLAVLFAHWTN